MLGPNIVFCVVLQSKPTQSLFLSQICTITVVESAMQCPHTFRTHKSGSISLRIDINKALPTAPSRWWVNLFRSRRDPHPTSCGVAMPANGLEEAVMHMH